MTDERKRRRSERIERLERELGAMSDRVKNEAERVRSEAQQAAERVREEAHRASDRVREEAHQAAERVKEEAHQAAERVKDEAPRKAIHLTMIVLPLGILYLPPVIVQRILILVAIALLVADLLKIHDPKLRSYFTAFFGHLIRRHEHAGITGSTYMIVSALVASYLFDREVAAASLVYLIVGDTLAAMVGKAWGRTRILGGKTLEGFLAGFVTSFLAAWLLVPAIPAWQLGLAAFAAAVVEILPIPVDDNFRIPLLSGLVLQWLR